MTDTELHRMVIERLQAIENKLDVLIEKVSGHEGRLQAIERRISAKIRRGERQEDNSQHRRNRLATILSGLLGAGGMWLLSVLTGLH